MARAKGHKSKKSLVQGILPFLLLGGGAIAGYSAGEWIGAAIGAGAGPQFIFR